MLNILKKLFTKSAVTEKEAVSYAIKSLNRDGYQDIKIISVKRLFINGTDCQTVIFKAYHSENESYNSSSFTVWKHEILGDESGLYGEW
jgi:hypothetical protein